MSRASRSARFAWAFYDWANNGYATIVLTFVGAAYVVRRVAPDENTGTALWGYAVGSAGLCVALLAPFAGAIADRGGRRKPWLAGFTLLCVIATGCLWWVRPESSSVTLALVLVATAAFGSDFALVFYNAMLPDLVPRSRLGRWSGWGWGLGYVGGLVCLIVVLFAFVRDGGWLGLATTDARNVRAVFPFVALWYLVFAIPLFVRTPDRRGPRSRPRRAVRDGLRQLRETVAHARRHRDVGLFLIARMLYVDALATAFALGGAYAAGEFDLDEAGVLTFGIVLNVAAGLGAFALAPIGDRIGDRRTLVLSLVAMTACAGVLVSIRSTVGFWIAAAAFGLFVGPVQANGRSFLARMTPERARTQFFGLYAFSGKATAFVGPLAVGAITQSTGNRRLGMGVIVVLLALGLVVLSRVQRDEATDAESTPTDA